MMRLFYHMSLQMCVDRNKEYDEIMQTSTLNKEDEEEGIRNVRWVKKRRKDDDDDDDE